MTEPARKQIDRRASRRRRHVEEHGIVQSRVRPGYDVSVIDVSAGGALVETRCRLLPGALVDLQLDTPHRSASIRGRVLRCSVSLLRSACVCYRGAIAFDRHLPWFADDEPAGYAVPTAECRPGGPGWEAATPHIV